MRFSSHLALAVAATIPTAYAATRRAASNFDPLKTCEVKAAGNPAIDDAPTILAAFKECGKQSRVVFSDTTYHINSVMEIRDLQDVQIDVHGTLLWGTDIDYWLANSVPVGYQNQSTALVIGGNNVAINGFGTGTFNGNGDTWYQWIATKPNKSNFPGRPHQVTFNGLTNSTVENLKFLRSQMWTMSIINSHYVNFDNIFVNNTGNHVQSFNNDGADTIYSSHIDFDNWTVYNGDDSISLKANSTDISIKNCNFYDGSGIAFGSIGQFKNVFETIQNVVVDNITLHNTIHAAWVKTWTNDQNGYSPNGGGGGLGFASNISLTNIHATSLRGGFFTISQCTRFSGAPGDGNCTNSKFQIRDISISNGTGTSKSPVVASLQCSAVAPCEDISISNVNLQRIDGGKEVRDYFCDHAEDLHGFNCTGKPCIGGSAIGECNAGAGNGAMLGVKPPKDGKANGAAGVLRWMGWRRFEVWSAIMAVWIVL